MLNGPSRDVTGLDRSPKSDPIQPVERTGLEAPAGGEVPAHWNRTEAPWPSDRCIHQLFEDQVRKTPEAIAVEFNDATLTYRELNERANQLAHFLRQLGVRPDSLVGISLERSLEVVVGVYGILKAGGTYVPLDPTYPGDRLTYMVQSARCAVLLTQEKLASRFAALPGVQILKLDTDWPTIATQRRDDPAPAATPDNLIYVIFTSGSTGQPKGAAVYHRGFTNLLNWFVTDFEITSADRTLLVSSLSFDLTQKNLYAPLIRGGRLHLYPPVPYDVSLLRRLIQKHGITLVNCTPSAFYPLIEPPEDATLAMLASLRIVFLGGESISIPRLRPWFTHPTCHADVANTYGPTECTDICGAYRLTRANLDRYGFVPLGRPVFNVQLAIVDSNLKPCSVGTPGELCVAGAGIGAGYLNDAAMTAARFVPNPFPGISGPTIYRTGDQARWLPDGVIEFLGRLDHQVKIRGFRIELQEIEAALDAHPAVRESIVVVKGAATEGVDPRLVCFFTVEGGQPPTAAVLREHLRSRLPDYMTPSAFHALASFPLSPNGKVDRRAIAKLPEPSIASASPAAPAPTNDLEQKIHQIWLEVLGRSQAGMDDNFFDVGGTSIQVAQVHTRLQTLLKRDLPITDLFAYPTIRALAGHLGAGGNAPNAMQAIKDRASRQREAMAARRLPRR